MFSLMTHSTHVVYGSTVLYIMVKYLSETHHTFLRVAARSILYVSSNRQDSTDHSFCYTSCGTLAGIRNSSMGPPWCIDPTIKNAVHTV